MSNWIKGSKDMVNKTNTYKCASTWENIPASLRDVSHNHGDVSSKKNKNTELKRSAILALAIPNLYSLYSHFAVRSL